MRGVNVVTLLGIEKRESASVCVVSVVTCFCVREEKENEKKKKVLKLRNLKQKNEVRDIENHKNMNRGRCWNGPQQQGKKSR